ncbi:MAG: hypothetical protein AAF563_04740 [Pseudomonadota bacterium]
MTSRSRPEGHVNDWPIEDYDAFVGMIELAEGRGEDHIVDRVALAARELGLRPDHWLVREALVGVYGKFPVYGGTFYAEDAEAFFRNATPSDLADRETVGWAKELAGAVEH